MILLDGFNGELRAPPPASLGSLPTSSITSAGSEPHSSGHYTSSSTAPTTPDKGITTGFRTIRPTVSAASAPHSSSTYAGSTKEVTVPTPDEEGSPTGKMTATAEPRQHSSSRYISSTKELVSSTQGIETDTT
ncbi:hypothetical protein COOONC_23540, partial [Cooperia oncophora]